MSADPLHSDAGQTEGAVSTSVEARINAMRAMFRVTAAGDTAMKRWLSRHPGGIDAAKMEIPTAPMLSEIMWKELQEQERIFLPDVPIDPPGDEIQYWMRRRRITQFHRWMRVVSHLPPCWHQVANASGDEIRKAASVIGFSAISTACQRRLPAELIRWLAPLGQDLATKIVVDIVENPAEPAERPVVVAWRAAYDTAAGFFRGQELLERTGFLVLAAVFHQLSQAHRLALGRAARSTLFESLSKLTGVDLLPIAIKAGEELIARAFCDQPDPESSRETDLESVELIVEK